MKIHEQDTFTNHSRSEFEDVTVVTSREGSGIIGRSIDTAYRVGAMLSLLATQVETVVGDALQRRYDK